MRKYLPLLLSVLLSFSVQSQHIKKELRIRNEIDSLKKILPGLHDSARIDCLNTLAYKYFWLPLSHTQKVDSSTPFTKLAIEEAKRVGYQKGLGFAYLRLGDYEYLKAEEYYWAKDEPDTTRIAKGEKFSLEAIKIGEEINDNIILGGGWWNMGALLEMRYWNTPQSKWKTEIDRYESYLKKAISYHEKEIPGFQKSKFREQGFVNCQGCKGNERWLGGLYRDLSKINSLLKPDHKTAIQYAKISISFFEKAGEDDLLPAVYETLATANAIEGNKNPIYWSEAIKSWQKAIFYYEKAGDHEKQITNAYEKIGQLYFRDNNFEPAIEYTKKAITGFQKQGNDLGEHRLSQALAAQYIMTGNYDNGFKICERSLQLAEKLANKDSLKESRNYYAGQSYLFMARLYKAVGDYETALNFIRKSHRHFPSDSNSMGSWFVEIGDLFRLMNNYDSAFHYLAQFETRSLFAETGKDRLGLLYIDQKQYSKALKLLNIAINRSREINDIAGLGTGLTHVASAYFGSKDYSVALKHAREGLTNLRLSQRKLMLMENYDLLSQIHHSLGRNDSAYFYVRQYNTLKDSLLNQQLYWRLNNYKKQAEEERKTSQINLLNKENQLKEQKLKQQATLRNSLITGVLLLLLSGVFMFRNLLLKRKNDKLQMQKDFEVQQLESAKKQAELHQRAVELEMQALRAQMSPHFIFNCLSSINRFIFKGDNKTASDYLTRFSRLIRMVLMHSQKKLIALEDELEMIRLYLDLERLRFKDAFDYSITTTNIVDAGNIFIPPLLLQPFCENAVWHGLMHKETKGHLNIVISEVEGENEKTLHCLIEDDGVGRDKAAELKSKSAGKEKSLGLKITTERIALLNKENNFNTFYKIDDIMNDQGEVSGTRVQLKIKYKEAVEEAV